jgi:SHS2 domain-containing protein
VRPSFDNGIRTVETHILGFDRDIYGCDLVVEFVVRLRDERRFEDIDDLVSQIYRDSQSAREILEREAQPADGAGGDRQPCPYRYLEIEHTADRALQVWGNDLPDLFVGAARGMYSLMADLDGLVATGWRGVRLDAWDRESLLVGWLNELLFLTEAEGLLFVECDIESLTDTALVARVGGGRALPTKAQIKAATFHNLALVRDENGWSTVITFDV